MSTSFPGFPAKALTFFRQLEKNNDRTWFAAHKDVYDHDVRGPMIELVRLVADRMRAIAADHVPDTPEKAIYRIYRDTRFSQDKTPYKTHIGAHLQHRRIPKNLGAGFYFEVSARALGIGGGLYMPGPEQLATVRHALQSQWKQFAAICADRALIRAAGPVLGEKAARVPKDFDPQSPAGEWLKWKQLYWWQELDPKLALTSGVVRQITRRFEAMAPAIELLNSAILSAVVAEEEPRPVRPEPMF